MSSRVLKSESFPCSETEVTHNAYLIAACVFIYLFFISMLPWGSLQKHWHSELAHSSRWWWLHRPVTSKHSFDTQEAWVLCAGGKCAGIYLHEKSSPCILCGQMMAQTDCFPSPTFKNTRFVCHHPLCMKRVWVQVLSYRSGGSCGPSKPPVLPATAVLCAWPPKRPGCPALTAAESAQKVSLRNKWNGHLFAKQKQRGRDIIPQFTHTLLQRVNVSKAQFKGTCDLCCKTNGCSQPRRLSKLHEWQIYMPLH